MYTLFHLFLFVITINKIIGPSRDEWLAISTQNPEDTIDIKNAKIPRRFLEDLDDYEWRIAHLRTAVWDGRRACPSDTFADRVKRYKKMLKEDGARVEYVSADPLPVNLENMVEESCEIKDEFGDLMNNATMKVTSANFTDPTTVSQNATNSTCTDSTSANSTSANSTSANTTDTIKVAETTPKLDFKATTLELKEKHKKEKLEGKLNKTRRSSEYMFSSVEYYDESIEFDPNMCPDAVEIISLQIDQLRSYDLECELMVEWRSLD